MIITSEICTSVYGMNMTEIMSRSHDIRGRLKNKRPTTPELSFCRAFSF